MNRRNFINIAAVGNFTKKAIENFEKNIVSKKNYLDKVNQDLKNKK